jgi:hypothetical protein
MCAANLSNSIVRSFDCDIDHYLVDVKVKEILVVIKQTVQKLMRVHEVNNRSRSVTCCVLRDHHYTKPHLFDVLSSIHKF